jgi:hypothetical protein
MDGGDASPAVFKTVCGLGEAQAPTNLRGTVTRPLHMWARRGMLSITATYRQHFGQSGSWRSSL